MAFEKGQVVVFKPYGDKRFPLAVKYHRVTKVEGRGRHAQVFTEDTVDDSFFLAEDLRRLTKKEARR